MAATPFVKFDDGSEGFAANCFPVRGLVREGSDVGGAWLVSHRAEQRRRFKAVLCAKPRTYARIKQERRKAEKRGATLATQSFVDSEDEKEEPPVLDGFFLMKHCCVEDPVDLCSVNIAGKELTECKEEDFQLFDNVAYVNAGENYLPFEAFRGFPIIRELEVPLNAIRSIKISPIDYPHLEMVDLSFNNLSQDDVLTLGTLKNLKVLHLTGNGFHTLPPDLALPYIDPSSKKQVPRFRSLEILMLDDNRLSDVTLFASLAGLKRLRHLNLEKNQIYYVPQLKSVEGTMIVNDDEKSTEKLRRSARKSARKSARTPKNVEKPKKSDTLIIEPTKPAEPEKTDLSKVKSDVESIPPMLAPANTEIKSSIVEGETSKKDSDLLDMEFSTSMGDLSSRIKDLDLPSLDSGRKNEHGQTSREPGHSGLETVMEEKPPTSSIPPFPELRFLSLAHNIIEEEEALLAVAAWPMLVELIIHHNPLTTERSGDPPLLARFLHDRLGIQLIRKQPEDNGLSKPKVEIAQKRSRQVATIVPKIPKIPVSELLMLEAPHPPTEPKQNLEQSQTVRGLDLDKKPLSPIPSATEYSRPFSADSHPQQPKEEEKAGKQKPTAKAWEEDVQPTQEQHADEGAAFFMTQVDDQEEEKEQAHTKPEKKERKHRKKHREAKDKTKVDDKYKGYEILLDYEEDPDFDPPKDMQGNIRALKYALNHELVYRDSAATLDKVQKPVEPYRKWKMPDSGPRKTKQHRVDGALENLKTRSTVNEYNLKEVLVGSHKNRSQRAEAQKLLDEIQRRYNSVRVDSMKEAREVKNLVAGIKSEVNKPTEAVTTS